VGVAATAHGREGPLAGSGDRASPGRPWKSPDYRIGYVLGIAFEVVRIRRPITLRMSLPDRPANIALCAAIVSFRRRTVWSGTS